MGVSTDHTRVLRTDVSGHFIVFLTQITVSYVNPHNDSTSCMETLRSRHFEIYFAHHIVTRQTVALLRAYLPLLETVTV
jgi:hypothetical protein